MRFRWKLDFTQYSVSFSDFPYIGKICKQELIMLLSEKGFIVIVPGSNSYL